MKRRTKLKSKIYQTILNTVGICPIMVYARHLPVKTEDAGVEFFVRALVGIAIYVAFLIVVKMFCEIYRKVCEEQLPSKDAGGDAADG